MAVLTIGWEYLTGYAVATDPSRRDRAEWPPHPGRVFMALAASWFETGEDPAEGEALRWLEALGDSNPPDMVLPWRDHVFERSAVTVYVPVNDKAGPAAATLQSAPSIPRNKQPRTFPRVWVGRHACYMAWPSASGVEQHREALDRLCSKVTRIGHSSSLVRMWVANDGELADDSVGERWVVDDELADHQVRNVSGGTLEMLAERFNALARDRHAELMSQIETLQGKTKDTKGRASKDERAAIEAKIASLRAEAERHNPRPPLRPSLGLWSGYRLADKARPGAYRPHSHFDTDVIVMVHDGCPHLPLSATLAVTQALRRTVMKHSGVQPAPAWVSGHDPNGQPQRSDDDVHLACIPLPFVGHRHADGHLLGAALVFPRSTDRHERGRVLGTLLLDEKSQAKPMELKLGWLGAWVLLKRDWNETRRALAPEAWTANPRGADTWGSVTPVVLDRFPKSDRFKDRIAWTNEVAGIVAAACVRIGLPEPSAVDIDTTSWHLGSPRATCKRRPLRGHTGISADGGAIQGDGFPPFPVRGTNSPRPQVHVWLRFSQPVVGPVLIGAGRYLGYGLCSPLRESSQ